MKETPPNPLEEMKETLSKPSTNLEETSPKSIRGNDGKYYNSLGILNGKCVDSSTNLIGTVSNLIREIDGKYSE
jgi:hypothetical protein